TDARRNIEFHFDLNELTTLQHKAGRRNRVSSTILLKELEQVCAIHSRFDRDRFFVSFVQPLFMRKTAALLSMMAQSDAHESYQTHHRKNGNSHFKPSFVLELQSSARHYHPCSADAYLFYTSRRAVYFQFDSTRA